MEQSCIPWCTDGGSLMARQAPSAHTRSRPGPSCPHLPGRPGEARGDDDLRLSRWAWAWACATPSGQAALFSRGAARAERAAKRSRALTAVEGRKESERLADGRAGDRLTGRVLARPGVRRKGERLRAGRFMMAFAAGRGRNGVGSHTGLRFDGLQRPRTCTSRIASVGLSMHTMNSVRGRTSLESGRHPGR
ncbi:hypothetical protein FKP32DRAFT_856700 [Trametes sanguinea]|nr:hypothetical protein FKP32DRAFT_856700 [Trametes sanguinea]